MHRQLLAEPMPLLEGEARIESHPDARWDGSSDLERLATPRRRAAVGLARRSRRGGPRRVVHRNALLYRNSHVDHLTSSEPEGLACPYRHRIPPQVAGVVNAPCVDAARTSLESRSEKRLSSYRVLLSNDTGAAVRGESVDIERASVCFEPRAGFPS